MKQAIQTISLKSIFFLTAITTILFSCSEDEATLRSENQILNFSILDGSNKVDLQIDEDNLRITGIVPFGFQLDGASTEITISDGASVSPSRGSTQNFSNPVSYVVTAENGDTKTYTIEVTVASNSENSILSFSVEIDEATYEATINETQQTITDTYPYFTDISALTPTITISENASISPSSGMEQDFTDPVTYVVTAEDGTEQTYTVELIREESPEKELLSFQVTINNEIYTASIDNESKVVRDTLPYFTQISALVPSINISEYATINPVSDTEQDFTNAVTYTVTAEDGTSEEYSIELYREKSPEKDLLSFSLDGTEVSKVSGLIDENTLTVSVRVPSNLDLSSVVPVFEISDRATITNDLSAGVDLTNDYIIEVKAEDQSSKSYTIQTESMNTAENISFEEGTANKWFGGDDRTNFNPRNIGTGQSIMITEDTHLQSFSVHFTRIFDFSENSEFIGHEVVINLEIRNTEGDSLTSVSVTNPASFNGGWVTFDFSSRSVFLSAQTEYIFIWYLPDGISENYSTGSSGDVDKRYTNGVGYSGTITSTQESITDWENWFEHPWDFWFRFVGLK